MTNTQLKIVMGKMQFPNPKRNTQTQMEEAVKSGVME